MQEAAYLIATLDQLVNYSSLINVNLVDDNTAIECLISVRSKEEKVKCNLNVLAMRLNFGWEALLPRVTLFQLLNQMAPATTLLDAMGFLILREVCEEDVSLAKLDKSGFLTYSCGLKQYQLETTKPSQELALGTHGILTGMQVIDHAGSHLVVKPYRGPAHHTTAYTCSCNHFQHYKRCDHIPFLRVIQNDRRLALSYQLLTIKMD